MALLTYFQTFCILGWLLATSHTPTVRVLRDHTRDTPWWTKQNGKWVANTVAVTATSGGTAKKGVREMSLQKKAQCYTTITGSGFSITTEKLLKKLSFPLNSLIKSSPSFLLSKIEQRSSKCCFHKDIHGIRIGESPWFYKNIGNSVFSK